MVLVKIVIVILVVVVVAFIVMLKRMLNISDQTLVVNEGKTAKWSRVTFSNPVIRGRRLASLDK